MTTIGAQYYRPPNPPREDWRRDLEAMRDAGLTTVKFWACWSWINTAPGVYDFDDLDELIDHAESVGLEVVINTIIENAPYWLEARHPEARYVDHEGRAVPLGAAMNTPGGGWPGLCFDNEAVWDEARGFLVRLVERYALRPAVRVWDVWNEPHLEPASYYPDRIYCYCEASLSRFGEWLRTRYRDITLLNETWARRFSDWDQVHPPRLFEAVPDMMDWREYWFANLSRWLSRRVAAVRETSPDAVVMTHVALSGFTGQLATHTLDEFTLTGDVDVFGTSSFPTWLMADDHVEHLLNLDTARDAAPHIPFWQAELQGGRGRRAGVVSTPQPRPAVVELWMWNALAAGATGIMFWQWRPELLGPESPGYGLCTPDGSVTPRVDAVTRFAEIARQPALQSRSTARPTLGLLVSRRSGIHAFATDRTMDLYRDAVMGAYRLLTDRDIPVTILHAETVESHGIPDHITGLYWPMPSVASTGLANVIEDFVRGGGRLLAEAGAGEYDSRGARRASVPPEALASVFGVSEIETTTVAGRVPLSLDGGGSMIVAWQTESLRLRGADALGFFADGSPAVTRQDHGRGEAFLIAGYPSVAYAGEADAATAQSIGALIAPDAHSVWLEVGPGLVSREALATGGRRLVFAMNWTSAPAQLRLREAELLAGSATDHGSGLFEVPALSGALLQQ